MSSAAALIHGLGAQGVTFRTENDRLIVRAPQGSIDQPTLKKLRDQKPLLIAELARAQTAAREERRQRLLQMMAEDDQPKKYYWITDIKADPDWVILALAIRDVGTCELLIPRERYDPFLLLESIGKEH